MELQAERDAADSQDIDRVVKINERIVDILQEQIPVSFAAPPAPDTYA